MANYGLDADCISDNLWGITVGYHCMLNNRPHWQSDSSQYDFCHGKDIEIYAALLLYVSVFLFLTCSAEISALCFSSTSCSWFSRA